jgi:hypothetical protein
MTGSDHFPVHLVFLKQNKKMIFSVSLYLYVIYGPFLSSCATQVRLSSLYRVIVVICNVQSEEIFLDMFEDEYSEMQKRPLNVEWLMMDSNILLPPTGTPMTGIEFSKRLPCGEVSLPCIEVRSMCIPS